MREWATRAWCAVVRFLRLHAVELYVVVAIVAFVFVLFPTRIIVDVPPGDVGVMWRRFQGGTDLCTVVPEGTHFIFPWDEIIKFDGRLLQRSMTIDALANNGLNVRLTVLYRYQLIRKYIPVLYEYAGPDYAAILLDPQIDVVTRNVISQKLPADIYADRPSLQEGIRSVVAWNFYAHNDPTNIPHTVRTPEPGESAFIDVPARPPNLAEPTASPVPISTPGKPAATGAVTLNQREWKFPKYEPPKNAAPLTAPEPPHSGNFLPCPSGSPVSHFVWLNLDNVLITAVQFPESLQRSITETNTEQQAFFSYYWKQRVADAEANRARAEAAGVRDASVIMSKGLTNNYLRYEGIEAIRSLASSPNAKIIVVGNGRDGLPIVLGADSGSTDTANAVRKQSARAGPLSPMQYLENQLSQPPPL